MSHDQGDASRNERPTPPSAVTQDIEHAAVGARLPEQVAQGIFTNSLLIVQAHDVFAIDFLSTVTQPQQVAMRVILPAATFGELLAAFQGNLAAYARRFGPLIPPAPNQTCPKNSDLPANVPASAVAADDASCEQTEPPPQSRLDALYDEFRLSDKVLGGVFANVVLICHTAHEFALDFICNLFPRAVVNARIYLPASRAPQFVDAIASSWERYRQRG